MLSRWGADPAPHFYFGMLKIMRLAALLLVGFCISGCASMAGSGIPARFADGRLVDAAGMSLYTFDRDRTDVDKRVCVDGCERRWPPFTAAPDLRGRGAYHVRIWADGVRQWMYLGRPLYRSTLDRAPDDTAGEGDENLWRLARRSK